MVKLVAELSSKILISKTKQGFDISFKDLLRMEADVLLVYTAFPVDDEGSRNDGNFAIGFLYYAIGQDDGIIDLVFFDE